MSARRFDPVGMGQNETCVGDGADDYSGTGWVFLEPGPILVDKPQDETSSGRQRLHLRLARRFFGRFAGCKERLKQIDLPEAGRLRALHQFHERVLTGLGGAEADHAAIDETPDTLGSRAM